METRNDLIFHNKNWSIPKIINKALLDQRLWMDVNLSNNKKDEIPAINQGTQRGTRETATTTWLEVIHKANSPCCLVDASWISSEKRAGIGCILMNNNGKPILKGSSSTDPIRSVLEAETIALREAILQLKRPGYEKITFCGNAK